ncbi:hypothetical protein B0H14DRAFT_3690243 [Mycena olivaceomarginata]|nr:hypothetical protein B0H14DRAFT_3690243 [Mycena olivaceomarginata]
MGEGWFLISEDQRIGKKLGSLERFSLDVCWALYFGRDFCGPPGPRRNIPMPFVDTEMDQIPWHYPPANIVPQPNYTTLIFFQSSALFVIARDIIDVVLELNNWKSQLPPEIDITLANRAKSTPQRLMLHLGYWWCFIVLHRPFFSRRAQPIQHSDREVDHVKRYSRASCSSVRARPRNILELTETWQSLYTLRLVPITMVQVLFNAGTIFLLRLVFSGGHPLVVVVSVVLRRLRYRRNQLYPLTYAGEPSLESILSTMPAPTYASSSWNPQQLVPSWTQSPIDFFAQTQNAPAATAFDAQSLYDSAFADVDMTALLPSIDYFPAQDLWEQGIMGDDRAARMLFSQGSS